jgi:hypothetical protein
MRTRKTPDAEPRPGSFASRRQRILYAVIGAFLAIGWAVGFLTDRVEDPVVGVMWLLGGVILLVESLRGNKL